MLTMITHYCLVTPRTNTSVAVGCL